MPKLLDNPKREYNFSDVVAAFETQMRVISALILRETKTRYGEHKIGFLWAVLEPVMMILVLVAIFSVMRSDTISGMPIVAFMLTGIVPFTLFRDAMSQLQGALGSNKMLLTFPQVTTFDVIAARAILETSVTLGVFALLITGAWYLGAEIRIENPLGVLAACFMLASLGVGCGFIFASLKPLFPSIQQMTSSFLGRPLFLGSGLFFTADTIPEPARHWLLYNPILNMLEILRSEFFYEFESQHGSWEYSLTWSFGALTTGLLVHQAFRRRATVGI